MPPAGNPAARRTPGDFTTDARVLLLSAMAVVVGALSAMVALALVKLIGLFTNVAYYHRVATDLAAPALHHLGFWAVLVPVAGGLVIGLMARYGSERIRGHGIPEALEAILIGRSLMSLKVAILKPLSSAISIGTGGPFGAEGPIIMTGGAFGSLFAQAFHLSPAERKTLLVAGAAGGMAAIFATPLAAALLAVELLLFEWKPRSFIPVALAAAVAGALRVPLLGAGPIFPVPPHGLLAWGGLLPAVTLGLVVGLASSLLTLLVYGCEDAFGHVPIHWMWWPAIGGLVIGLGGLVAPRALGVGYDVITDLLGGHLVGGTAAVLLLVKAIIWAVALGSGTSGGVLAPLLIMGGALGSLAASWLPGHDVPLWAMVGMGAMMGGTMRAPFTAVAFVLELTHDVATVPAVLAACIAADAVTVLLMKRSILTEKVARRGHHVMREYSVNPLHLLRVRDAMDPAAPVPPASAAPAAAPDVVAYPDELLEEASARLLDADATRIPVVSRDDGATVIGMLRRSGVMAAWLEAARDEHTGEPGYLSARLRLLRGRIRRLVARAR